jgi:uncharacterized protein YbcC (UPF0753/DUF2309 family)
MAPSDTSPPVSAPVHPRDVATLVEVAQRVVPPMWGLDSFVAVNPLVGFEDLAFEDAVAAAADLFDARGFLPTERASTRARRPSVRLQQRGTAEVAELTDVFVAHWCASYLSGSVVVRGAESGLYSAWRALAAHDPDLRRWAGRDAGRRARALPATGTEAVSHLLAALGIGEADAVAYLEAQLTRLPGWTAVMARRVEAGCRHDLVDFVAVRLAVERLFVDGGVGRSGGTVPVADAARPDDATVANQVARESRYRDHLLGLLTEAEVGGEAGGEAEAMQGPVPPRAQVVCCIDVRSEGLRRHLESVGPYETLGFAGFFGLPIAVQTVDALAPVASCPVILTPTAVIPEQVVSGSLPLPEDRDLGHRVFHAAKTGSTSGFVLADAAGWMLGLRSLAQSLAPGGYQRARRSLRRLLGRPVRSRFVLDTQADRGGVGWSIDEQTQAALGALTAMGLTSGFAPLVVLCGHRSANLNNPYRSALDCGACGGHAGGPNARILAAICNRPEVRAELAALGVVIDDTTWFVAAEHETTTDAVELLDLDAVPASHREAIAELERDLARAGAANRAERWAAFPWSPLPCGSDDRSSDPAQVVPDWGLARCAAIVIGPRSLTAGRDLERRVFLHSYAPDADPDGLVLEAIMTGPVVVAHWICSQYYFSTVDPDRFGAGSKPLHNVIDRVGVAVGAEVDVRIGLPLESVWFDGRPVHEPLRLLVVVDAPAERVEAVIARNPVLRRLFGNGWATVAARGAGDPAGFVVRSRSGEWQPWTPAALPGASVTASTSPASARSGTPESSTVASTTGRQP